MATKPKINPPYVIGDKKNPWGGLNTATKDNRDMDVGESYDQLNWLTGRDQDNIQLRRGQALLGTTRRNIANQHVSGIGVGTLFNGQQQLMYSFAQKLMFYNNITQDTQEVNTVDILPAAANDEDITFSPYSNVAGSFLYASSPNSSIYKIPVADPGDPVDQQVTDFHFGYIRFDQSRMVACNRQGITDESIDRTGLYLSAVDDNTPSGSYIALPPAPKLMEVNNGTGNITNGTYYYVLTAIGPTGVETTIGGETSIVISDGPSNIQVTYQKVSGATGYKLYRSTTSGSYTTPSFIAPLNVAASTFTDNNATPSTGMPPATTTQGIISPIGIGDGSTKTFSGTFSSGVGVPDTLYGVQVTDGNELFQDDRNGNLVGNMGGTGTINYSTGAYSVTFNTAPVLGAQINASFLIENATLGGVVDFRIDGTDSSKAQVFRQDDGGGVAQSVWSFQGVDYCLHVLRSWQFSIGETFSNLPYFEQIGIPFFRAAYQTGDGVIFLDNANPANPTFSILEIPPGSTNLTVVPQKLSDKLDLSAYGFTRCVVRRWGDFDIIGVEVPNQIGEYNGFNTQCFVRNIWSGLFNRLDYEFSCLEEFVGTLVSGDSLSPNIFTLFSGFDDDGEIIDNYYNHAFLNLGMDGLKKAGYIHIEGLIQQPQSFAVNIALDTGGYVNVATVKGNGPYVDQGVSVGIGTYTMGSTIIGGLGSGAQFANKFELDIPIHTDKFEYISFQLQAIGIGYVQINKVSFKDIRVKRRRLLQYEDQEIDNN